jgi:hypothetical protein
MLESIELHVSLADATERGSELREALLRVPGVHSVGAITPDEVAALVRVVVGFSRGRRCCSNLHAIGSCTKVRTVLPAKTY